MGLSMKMAHWRKDGFDMWTKVVRKMAKLRVALAGHCSDGGHCY